ncbi:MAG: hypothetical protein RIR12_105 [Bacteroidota bacterium]|jgi:hypothetical protein
MKNFALFFVTCFFMAGLKSQTSSLPITTHTTAPFRDGTSKKITGFLVGEVLEKSSISGNSKTIKYIYSRKDSVITIHQYTEWTSPASGMDDIRIYQFKTGNIVTEDGFDSIDENEADESYSKPYFGFRFNGKDDYEIGYEVYNRYDANKPSETRKWSSVSIQSFTKENIEKMLEDIKLVIPKPAEEE